MLWTLDDGLNLIRALQPFTRKFNYHLCLGGGVLNKGSSEKDLDLYFLPMENGLPSKADDLVQWLTSLWGTPEDLKGEYDSSDLAPVAPIDEFVMHTWIPSLLETQPSTLSSIYKRKLKYTRPDGRIDVFIM